MIPTLSQLSPDSTLRALPAYTLALDSQQPLQVIAHQFEQDPHLPGVLVTQGSRLVGIVSRSTFQAGQGWAPLQPSAPPRTIAHLLAWYNLKPLQLPDTCKIDAAVRMALKRPPEAIYEPIVVERRDLSIALIDVKVLLLAQSQILMAVNQVVQQQKLIIREYHTRLEQEQKTNASQTEIIAQQKVEIAQSKKALELQKLENLNHSRQLMQVHRCLDVISRTLAQENMSGLETALEGVQAICNNILAITETGQALHLELDSFQENSRAIEKISQQVQHLAVQATVAANQSTEQMGNFGRITTDISKFAAQLLDISQRLEQFVYRFKTRIQDLTQVAQRGTNSARSLVTTVESAEGIWHHLDAIIQEHNAVQSENQKLSRPLPQEVPISFLAQDLKHRIDRAEQALTQLTRKVSQTQTALPLVSKLGRALDVAKSNGMPPTRFPLPPAAPASTPTTVAPQVTQSAAPPNQAGSPPAAIGDTPFSEHPATAGQPEHH
ncbi:hypothetical protein [Trichothermofontia sp.]